MELDDRHLAAALVAYPLKTIGQGSFASTRRPELPQAGRDDLPHLHLLLRLCHAGSCRYPARPGRLRRSQRGGCQPVPGRGRPDGGFASGTRVAGHIDLGPDHHTPWGVVQGGVYATAVESAAGLGASLAVRDRGQFAVGVHNATDFLRPATSGRAEVIAEPLQQGRVQQLWLVTITDERGRALARGQLRLQNVPLPGTGTN